jgi:membrane protein involved in D-alanine export
LIPYSNFTFFAIIFFLLLPAVFLGYKEKNIAQYGLFATIVVIVLILGDNLKQYVLLSGFYLFELILIKFFLTISKKTKSTFIFYSVVILSIVPMILFRSVPSWHFLGVSYMSFRAIQIILEIRDGLIKEVSVLEYSYFLLFFPTISSGPIDRSRRFNQDIKQPLKKDEYHTLLKSGIYKLFLGIGYKFIIGSLVSVYWMKRIPRDGAILHAVNYMYAYSMYLFFDFAGYSLMAVGVSHVLGLRVMDNFNLPFISKDIKEFWNRWHMSLSYWFRDFIYTRFVMSAVQNGWFKSRLTASYLGFFITMTTMGIWHGLSITYAVYGCYHGLMLSLTDFLEKKTSWYNKSKKSNLGIFINVFITFQLVCFGMLIFSGYFGKVVRRLML